MRLVRFEDESGGFAVDLHPLITVISGLPAHVRERLVHGLAALPRGTDPGGRGSIEVHGVYLDLNRESLELLELSQDLDVILRPSDLPGSELVADEPPMVDDSDAAGVDDDEISDARRVVQEHEEAYEAAVQSVEAFRSQLSEIESEQSALHHQLADARTGLDSFAMAGLKIAREELAELEAALAPVPEPVLVPAAPAPAAAPKPAPTPSAAPAPAADLEADRARVEGRLTVLIDESDRLKRMIKALKAIDPAPVRAAYAVLEATDGTTTAVASPDAEALAAEWIDIEERLAALEPVHDEGRELLDALTTRRDDAYDAMKLAERNLRAPELDPAAVDRLESIHDEIFELDGKSSRFGAAKGRRRLEVLRIEETTLLKQLGFETWSSYIMGITSAGSDPARRREFEQAGQAYERAEADLSHAAAEPAEVRVDPRLEQLESARVDVFERIVALLGTDPGDDPVPALRAVRIEVATPGSAIDPDAAAIALQEALESTGANIPEDTMGVVELRSLAAGWLETMDQLPERIADAIADRAAIEEEISELAVELEAIESAPVPEPVAADPEPAWEPEPEAEPEPESFFDSEPHAVDYTPEMTEALARVTEGEDRVRAHEAAVARIADIESLLERLVEAARELQQALAEREPRVATLLEQRVAARNRLRRAEADRSAVESARWENRHHNNDESGRYLGGSAGAEAVEWYVLARLAQQRSVSFVGSVPLVIDDAFVNWPVEALGDVFTRLERMGEVIQIVYLTDDPDVGAWGRSLGSDRALVLDMRVAS